MLKRERLRYPVSRAAVGEEQRDTGESLPVTPAVCRRLACVAGQGCSDRRPEVCSRTGLSQVMDPKEDKVKSRADQKPGGRHVEWANRL